MFDAGEAFVQYGCGDPVASGAPWEAGQVTKVAKFFRRASEASVLIWCINLGEVWNILQDRVGDVHRGSQLAPPGLLWSGGACSDTRLAVSLSVQ